MSRLNQYIIFNLDEQRFAMHFSAVERVIRAVEVTPLPKAPEIVPGVVNIQGRIIPVVNIRKRFRLPEREMDLSDQFIIAHTSRRTVALVVDAVSSVIERSEQEVIAVEKILPEMEYVKAVVKLKDGIILILNLEKFLFFEEEKMLDDELKNTQKEAWK